MPLRNVRTRDGTVEGIAAGNPAYTVFKGVPYGRPPVGALRWAPPQPPAPWDGVRRCDTFPPVSIQAVQRKGDFYQREFFPVDMPMSEDCLYLNIWTPAETAGDRLPVMMWIHGGGFMQGYGHEMEFDGEALCKHGVILVTITYRLGALGFLAHPELSKRSPQGVSGNYGILDCIHALEWLHENIAAFGGDAGNITIFGQSAGGMAVQALVTTPLARGLAAKAIVQSAGGIITMGGAHTLQDGETLGAFICRDAGCTFEQLLEMPAERVRDITAAALSRVPQGGQRLRMAPVVDGWLLPDSAASLVARGEHADIPYLTGSVSGDGGLFGGRPAATVAEFEQGIRSVYGAAADKYLALFNVKDDKDLERAQAARKRAASMLAPRGWARAHQRLGRRPVYTYYFCRDIPGEDHPGAFHSSELWYLFGTLARCWRPMEALDYGLSLQMTAYWANFAKTGDPNGPGLPAWPAFTAGQPLTMRFDESGAQAADLGGDPILEGMERLMLEQVYGS